MKIVFLATITAGIAMGTVAAIAATIQQKSSALLM